MASSVSLHKGLKKDSMMFSEHRHMNKYIKHMINMAIYGIHM